MLNFIIELSVARVQQLGLSQSRNIKKQPPYTFLSVAVCLFIYFSVILLDLLLRYTGKTTSNVHRKWKPRQFLYKTEN